MIAISAFVFGLMRYEKYKRRPRDIEFFIKLLSAYSAELKWSRKTLDEIISSCVFPDYEQYVDTVKALICAGDSRKDAFTVKNSEYDAMSLTDDDRAVLNCFFAESGRGGLVSEQTLCNRTLDALENAMQNARDELKRHGVLSLKLGAVCGVWIMIMLV